MVLVLVLHEELGEEEKSVENGVGFLSKILTLTSLNAFNTLGSMGGAMLPKRHSSNCEIEKIANVNDDFPVRTHYRFSNLEGKFEFVALNTITTARSKSIYSPLSIKE